MEPGATGHGQKSEVSGCDILSQLEPVRFGLYSHLSHLRTLQKVLRMGRYSFFTYHEISVAPFWLVKLQDVMAR